MNNNTGMIIKCVAGVYDVLIDNEVHSAYGAGKFRNQNISPLVGDDVVIKFSERNGEKNLITDILPRKNALLRPPVANVSTLIITLAVKKPNPDLKLIDQLICYCRLSSIEPIICINKSDYDFESALKIKEQYLKSNISAIITSADSNSGIDELRSEIKPGITCFCGQSAVGKSTLTNLLLGKKLFETGGLSKKTERGKHTTRHCELVKITDDKWIADTPGFSLLEAPELSPEDFKNLYYEFDSFADECRFIGCNHINEPDCAVKKAVKENVLSIERFDRYKQLYEEVKEKWRKRYD